MTLRPPPPLPVLADAAAAAAWLAARVPPQQARLVVDSRRLQPGDGFIAWPGAATDGRRYVPAALAAGAAACLVEAEGVEDFDLHDERIAAVAGLKAAAGPIAARWQGNPAHVLQVIAVTGTNGKSSTAWWTAQALTLLGRPCQLVGTLGIGTPPLPGRPGSIQYTGLTTPDPVTLHAGFAAMVAQGCQACAIEASSIGIAEHRLAGTPITVAQFTNFTRDHLDYHGDMAAYWQAKRQLFSWPGLQAAVVNVDDPQGRMLAEELAVGWGDGAPSAANVSNNPPALWTTGLQQPAALWQPNHLHAQQLRYVDGGLAFDVVEGNTRVPVRSTLIGDYNALNLLAVLGALRALGVPLAESAAVVPQLTPVPGRMDRVAAAPGQPEVVVDYAHTPDALDKALAALRPLARARGGQLWCVFGCGGNRDASKRPLMGAIAQQGADRVLVTSDNPRDEDPLLIIGQIVAGMADPAGVPRQPDRRAAITQAITQAAPVDVLLLAGKGHEDYQEMAGRKLPFLDSAVAAEALTMRAAA